MTEDIAKKVFELKGKGLSQRKTAEALGIKRSEVQKILKSPGSTTTKPPTNQSTSGSTGSTTLTTGSTTQPPSPPATEAEEKGIPESFEKELWIKATPSRGYQVRGT